MLSNSVKMPAVRGHVAACLPAPSPRLHLAGRRHGRGAIAERMSGLASSMDGLRVQAASIERDATATASTSGHGHTNGWQQQQGLGHAGGSSQQEGTWGPGGAAGDKDLYEEIKACEHWKDVLDLVADEAGRMSLYTAVQAASRIVALSRGPAAGGASPGATAAALAVEPSFQTLVGVLLEGVPNMTRVQLCNSLHALGVFRVPLPEAAAKAYSERAAALAQELNARDVAQLLHGFATACSISMASSGAGSAGMATSPSYSHTLAGGHASGASACVAHPGRKTLDMVGFRAKQLLDAGAFEPQGIAMALHACAVLEYKNLVLLGSAAEAAVTRMPDFTPQGVANVCWALAKLDYYSHGLMQAACDHLLRVGPAAYKPQEAANLLWAFASHRFYPQEALAALVRSLAERAAGGRGLRPADYGAAFHALGTFGVHPGRPTLKALCAGVEAGLAGFGPVELCNVYWGLSLIGEACSPTAHRIARLLPDQYEANALDEGLLRQAFTGLLCAKLAEQAAAAEQPPSQGEDGSASSSSSKKEPLTSPSFPPLMLDAMKRAWVAGAMANNMDPRAAAGAGRAGTPAPVRGARARAAEAVKFKHEVARMLKALGVRHKLAQATRDGLVSVDVALQPRPERFVALQVVSEHEHTRNTGQLLGPTQFQAALLEVNGWEVRYLRAKDLKTMAPEAQQGYLAELLRSFGCRVAAAGGPDAAGGTGAAGAGAAQNGLDMLVEAEGEGRGGAGRGGAARKARGPGGR